VARDSLACGQDPVQGKGFPCPRTGSGAWQEIPLPADRIRCVARDSLACGQDPVRGKGFPCPRTGSGAWQGIPLPTDRIRCVAKEFLVARQDPLHSKGITAVTSEGMNAESQAAVKMCDV